jgi:hypothetical protein
MYTSRLPVQWLHAAAPTAVIERLDGNSRLDSLLCASASAPAFAPAHADATPTDTDGAPADRMQVM